MRSTVDAPQPLDLLDEDTSDDGVVITEDERRLGTVAAHLESVTVELAAGDIDAAATALADAVATLDGLDGELKLGTSLLAAYRALAVAHRGRLDNHVDALIAGDPPPPR